MRLARVGRGAEVGRHRIALAPDRLDPAEAGPGRRPAGRSRRCRPRRCPVLTAPGPGLDARRRRAGPAARASSAQEVEPRRQLEGIPAREPGDLGMRHPLRGGIGAHDPQRGHRGALVGRALLAEPDSCRRWRPRPRCRCARARGGRRRPTCPTPIRSRRRGRGRSRGARRPSGRARARARRSRTGREWARRPAAPAVRSVAVMHDHDQNRGDEPRNRLAEATRRLAPSGRGSRLRSMRSTATTGRR